MRPVTVTSTVTVTSKSNKQLPYYQLRTNLGFSRLSLEAEPTNVHLHKNSIIITITEGAKASSNNDRGLFDDLILWFPDVENLLFLDGSQKFKHLLQY